MVAVADALPAPGFDPLDRSPVPPILTPDALPVAAVVAAVITLTVLVVTVVATIVLAIVVPIPVVPIPVAISAIAVVVVAVITAAAQDLAGTPLAAGAGSAATRGDGGGRRVVLVAIPVAIAIVVVIVAHPAGPEVPPVEPSLGLEGFPEGLVAAANAFTALAPKWVHVRELIFHHRALGQGEHDGRQESRERGMDERVATSRLSSRVHEDPP